MTIPDWQTGNYSKTICGKKIMRWWKELQLGSYVNALHRCCSECYKIASFYEEEYEDYKVPWELGDTGDSD